VEFENRAPGKTLGKTSGKIIVLMKDNP